MNIEPGTNEDIKEFVAGYGVEFDMFDKIDVNGSDAHPLYVYLKKEQKGFLLNAIKWNFSKVSNRSISNCSLLMIYLLYAVID